MRHQPGYIVLQVQFFVCNHLLRYPSRERIVELGHPHEILFLFLWEMLVTQMHQEIDEGTGQFLFAHTCCQFLAKVQQVVEAFFILLPAHRVSKESDAVFAVKIGAVLSFPDSLGLLQMLFYQLREALDGETRLDQQDAP